MTDYPENSLQGIALAEEVLSEWFVPSATIRRGSVVWAHLPTVSVLDEPYTMEALEHGDPEDHSKAAYAIARHRTEDPDTQARSVAAMPPRPDEAHCVYRARYRPALVLAGPGRAPDESLQAGGASWQHAQSLIVAPYYGVGRAGFPGGWDPRLIDAVQACEFPQYMWESLPFADEDTPCSILRFDHLLPLGARGPSIQNSEWALSDEALDLVDMWLGWFLSGEQTPEADGTLDLLRGILLDELDSGS